MLKQINFLGEKNNFIRERIRKRFTFADAELNAVVPTMMTTERRNTEEESMREIKIDMYSRGGNNKKLSFSIESLLEKK